MFRTILKVVYVGVSFFLGMIMYMGQYQSNGFDAILNKANGYITEENYDELARMLGGIVNQDEVLTINEATKENMMLLYEGTTLSSNKTYKKVTDDKGKESYEEKELLSFSDAYFLMIMNPKFETENLAGDNPTNKTAVVFTTADDAKKYEYKMIQNATVNKDFYDEHPATLNESILEGARDMIALEDAYGFFSLIFDEKLLDAINTTLGTPVTGFYLIDNEGHKVADSDVTFSFSYEGKFFSDMKPLAEQYDIYIDAYQKNQAGDIKKDAFKKISDDFQKYTEDFDDRLTTDEAMKSYKKGFDQSELITSAVMWKTIGQMSIYAVVAIVLYFLLFKFAQVCAMFSKLWCKITGKTKTDKHAKPVSTRQHKMSAKDTSNRTPIVKSLVNDEEAEASNEEVALDEESTDDSNEEAALDEESTDDSSEEAALDEEALDNNEEATFNQEEVVEPEIVDENPLSEVVADAPLEDAEEEKKSE